MQKCPYNPSVDCDVAYQNAEFRRQLAITAISGGYWFKKLCPCPAKRDMCQRLVNAARCNVR